MVSSIIHIKFWTFSTGYSSESVDKEASRMTFRLGIYCEFMHDGHKVLPTCKAMEYQLVTLYI